jgi:hypothetical protein
MVRRIIDSLQATALRRAGVVYFAPQGNRDDLSRLTVITRLAAFQSVRTKAQVYADLLGLRVELAVRGCRRRL